MSIRTGIEVVTCPLTWVCGESLSDTKLNQMVADAKSAYNKGETVLNIAGLGQINLFDTVQSPEGELDKSIKTIEFENPGYNKYLFACKFRVDPVTSSGTYGASRVKIFYVPHTGSEVTLLDASTNTTTYPGSTLYTADTLHRVEATGTVPTVPSPGESEWHSIRVEYYVPAAVNWDKEFMNDNGVSWLHLKLYGEC